MPLQMSENLERRHLAIHPKDNVWVALRHLDAGQSLSEAGKTINLNTAIPAKHKFAIVPIPQGGAVILYGIVVGKALEPIGEGEQVTTRNCIHQAQAYSIAQREPFTFLAPTTEKWAGRTFMGYSRSDGRVGTRNYWLVLPLVFCENRNIQMMKEAFDRELGFGQPQKYRDLVRDLLRTHHAGGDVSSLSLSEAEGQEGPPFPNPHFPQVDGIRFLTHEMGCGGTNRDCQTLAAVLAGCCVNPNVAGITVLSLGCQKTTLDDLQAEIVARSPHFDKPLYYFNQQAYGTETAMLAAAIGQTFQGLVKINQLQREPQPLHKLCVGLKCGGSDGFSGISANPSLGVLSDILVSLGATTLLAEFPELCGVEQELINRCEDPEDAEKFIALMTSYASEAEAVGAGFDMNPSKGNIRDGLITDAMKSAGAARKGGYAPIRGVLEYTGQPERGGLHLLCTPGNDVLATSGMAASGANVILFTTGLGTPTGNALAPTIKIATHSALQERMPDIIDFDAGGIISGKETLQENGEALLERLLSVASGTLRTHAERLGQDDFIPWRRDINL